MSGNAWMYSDRIDDLDLHMLQKDFITLQRQLIITE